MKFWKEFFASLLFPEVMPSAIRVAVVVVVGSVLFAINHGKALMNSYSNMAGLTSQEPLRSRNQVVSPSQNQRQAAKPDHPIRVLQ
jgi:hypothetical protein